MSARRAISIVDHALYGILAFTTLVVIAAGYLWF